MYSRLIFVVLFCIFALGNCQTVKWNAGLIPNPQDSPQECGLDKIGEICDPNFLLTANELTALNDSVYSIMEATTCVCAECPGDKGFTIGVLVIKDVYLPPGQTGDEAVQDTIKTVADDVREKWALGECQDDALILYVADRKTAYTSIGPKTRITLNMECSNAIVNSSTELFEAGKVLDGLLNLLNKYKSSLKNAKCAINLYADNGDRIKGNEDSGNQELIVICIGVAVVVCVVIACAVALFICHRKQPKTQGRFGAGEDEAPIVLQKTPKYKTPHHGHNRGSYKEAPTKDHH